MSLMHGTNMKICNAVQWTTQTEFAKIRVFTKWFCYLEELLLIKMDTAYGLYRLFLFIATIKSYCDVRNYE